MVCLFVVIYFATVLKYQDVKLPCLGKSIQLVDFRGQWCSLRCTCIQGASRSNVTPWCACCIHVPLRNVYVPLCLCGISLRNYTFATPCICTKAPPLTQESGISMIIGIRFCANTGMSPSLHYYDNQPQCCTSKCWMDGMGMNWC